MIEIKVPTVGESINEVTLIKWLKNDGEYVERDEVIAELESEKATFEVNAEQAGVLKTVGHEGDTLNIGDVLATIDETAAKAAKAKPAVKKDQPTNGTPTPEKSTVAVENPTRPADPAPQPATPAKQAAKADVKATP